MCVCTKLSLQKTTQEGKAPPLFVETVLGPKRWKQPKCLSPGEWITTLWSIRTMEYYTATNRDRGLTPASLQMDLEDTILMRDEDTRSHIVCNPMNMRMCRMGRAMEAENTLVVVQVHGGDGVILGLWGRWG